MDIYDKLRAPDLTEAVCGVRSWQAVPDLVSGDWCLLKWSPGKNEATCLHSPLHKPPMDGCGCGLYAYHEVSKFDSNGVYGDIWGSVIAWGKLRVTKDGFRAQYTAITGICPAPGASHTGSFIDDLAERYGVPVVSFDKLESHAALFGTPVPLSLRPETKDVELGDLLPVQINQTRPSTYRVGTFIPQQPRYEYVEPPGWHVWAFVVVAWLITIGVLVLTSN